MNRIYRQVWSSARGAWMVAGEGSRTRGKGTPLRRRAIAAGVAAIFGARIALGAPPVPPPPATLPTSGQVVSGQATINTAGATMSINQSTQRAILNWQSFSIGSGAAVNFIQPDASSVALNRVLGADPSAIYGKLSANGQVFLVNPNGVLFGPGAKVDVGGLVASTLAIRNEDFLAGRYRFTRDGGSATVENHGELIGKYVALLAPEVRNQGIVTARMGTAALAAGDAVTLDISGNRLIGVQVDRASINTLIENRNLIQVDGGAVVLSAQSANALLGRVVNSGAVEAGGISTDGGVVRLLASSAVNHSGRISADAGTAGKGGNVILLADLANPASRTEVSGSLSARGGAQSGDGGFIETSASKLKIADSARIDTSAPHGATGQWLLDPFDFTIAAANGDITGAALSAALVNNDVKIQTGDTSATCTGTPAAPTCGAGRSGDGDINVNDSVTWNTVKTLTLSAYRNVNINAPINVNGAGGLALEFDNAENFSGAYFVNAPVNLAAGAAFSTKFGSFPTVNYSVISDAGALAGIATNDPNANYVLGTDVALSGNWTPIGTTASAYMGNFDGLGHKVTGLSISGYGTEVGLFGVSGGNIQNVGVTGVNVEGTRNVGALVGVNGGFVVNSYSSGTVKGNGIEPDPVDPANNPDTVHSVGAIGGLVGRSSGTISQSYSTATITATGDQTSGTPMGTGPFGTGSTGGIGGLVGVMTAAVNGSYAKGSVTGVNAVGGLVGYSAGAIDASFSTGAVSLGSGASPNIGGLLGQVDNPSSIPFVFASFWETTNNPGLTGGGVPGVDEITGLNAAGMKTASNFTAGGVDWATRPFSSWELRDGQYPLIKSMLQPIYVIADNRATTYNGGAVTGFTTTISPTTTSAANYTGTATVTPSTANPTNAGTYTLTPGGISVADPGDQHGYRIETVNGTLTIAAAPLTVISGSVVNPVTKVYDGTLAATLAASNYLLTGWQSTDGASITKTTGTYGNANAGTNVSVTVSLTLGDFLALGTTNLGNYTLPTSVTGNVGIITKAPLAVAGSSGVNKSYDSTAAMPSLVSGYGPLTGAQFGSDAVTLTGAAIYDSANAGSRTVNQGTVALTGAGSGNYQLTWTNGTGTISKATLTLAGASNVDKVYDKTTAMPTAVSGYGVLTGTQFGTDNVLLTGAAVYDSVNAGARSVQQGTLDLTGAGSGNYQLSWTNGSGTISPRAVNTTVSKTYNASDSFSSGFAFGNVVSGDSVTVTSGSAEVSSANAATYTSFAGNNLLLSNPNYTLTGGTVSATINPKALAVAGTTASGKVYDGSSTAIVNVGTLSGFVGTETVTATGAGNFDSANAGSRTATANYVLADGSNGGLAANYTLANSSGLAATITPKALAIAGTTAADKVYDGNTTAVLTPGILSGFVGTETVTATGTGAFNSANAGAVTATGSYVLANGTNGGLASNYSLANTTGHAATISQRVVNTTASKTYDATDSFSSGFSFGNVVSGDSLSVASGTAEVSSRNAGSYSSFTGNSLVLSSANYTLAGGTVSATINPKALDILNLSIGENGLITGLTDLFGSPGLRPSVPAGTVAPGASYDVDGPLTLTGKARANLIKSGETYSGAVTGVSLNGTGAGNYTLTGNSVSAKVLPSVGAPLNAAAAATLTSIDNFLEALSEGKLATLMRVSNGETADRQVSAFERLNELRSELLAARELQENVASIERRLLNEVTQTVQRYCATCRLDGQIRGWIANH